jgi:hypothetical protein
MEKRDDTRQVIMLLTGVGAKLIGASARKLKPARKNARGLEGNPRALSKEPSRGIIHESSTQNGLGKQPQA